MNESVLNTSNVCRKKEENLPATDREKVWLMVCCSLFSVSIGGVWASSPMNCSRVPPPLQWKERKIHSQKSQSE